MRIAAKQLGADSGNFYCLLVKNNMVKIYFPEKECIYSKKLNFSFLFKYASFKKMINLGKSILAQKKKTRKPSSLPYVVYIDPANICPLECPLCPTGLRKQGRNMGVMGFSLAKKIIDELKDYLFFIRLYNWGEPFLNKDIFRIINYAYENRVGTVISTNFNFIDDKILESIVNSSLNHLIVSIGGASQETYEKYQRGGDFEKAAFNLKKLVELRKTKKNKNLKIEWLFVVNRFNQSEVEKAKQLALKWGVDILHFSPVLDSFSLSRMDCSGEETYKNFKIDSRQDLIPPKTCSWLYSRMVFNWDGKASPCCALDNEKTDFGDAAKENIKDIWNNKHYQTARKIFKYDLKSEYPEFICSRCLFMKKDKYEK